MSEMLEHLCTLLEAELARQGEVYQACLAQRAAVARQDIAQVEQSAKAINALIRAAKAAERERLHVVGEIVQTFQLPLEQQTLTGLIQAVPEPWRHRLAVFQAELRRIVAATRAQAHELSRSIQYALRAANEAMGALTPRMERPYDARGVKSAPLGLAPALIDQRG